MERQSIGVEVLVWKYHVFILHVDLLEQSRDVSNNPAIRTEDDPGTARSKKITSKAEEG